MGKQKLRTQNKYVVRRKRKSFKLIKHGMTGEDAIAQTQCDSPNHLKSASAKKFDLLDINLEELQGTDISHDSALDGQDHFMIGQKKSLYRFINTHLCPKCHSSGLEVNTIPGKSSGFSAKGHISCSHCNAVVSGGFFCERVKQQSSSRA